MIQQCRKNAAEMGVANQASFIEGDLFEADFKGPYDLILVGRYGNDIYFKGMKPFYMLQFFFKLKGLLY